MKRIKHNDLLPWFTDDHRDLPSAYLKSCHKFFDSLKQQAPSPEPRAASRKRQAASNKQKGKNVRNFYNFY
jgi:mRNA-degrading endonuclease RelE of RelBE toxin-antitoxin system